MIKGFYPVMSEGSYGEGEKQTAATYGYLCDGGNMGTQQIGNVIRDEVVIIIDATQLNDTNNSVENIMTSVRKTLEMFDAKRKSNEQE